MSTHIQIGTFSESTLRHYHVYTDIQKLYSVLGNQINAGRARVWLSFAVQDDDEDLSVRYQFRRDILSIKDFIRKKTLESHPAYAKQWHFLDMDMDTVFDTVISNARELPVTFSDEDDPDLVWTLMAGYQLELKDHKFTQRLVLGYQPEEGSIADVFTSYPHRLLETHI